ncbi:transcriptional regulator [Limosilactobacillus sp.]|uniref:transcriptional regulator n=1 Tax=Limosilactobacillus sp. TaxID=2773925 RepID=UPI0025BE91F1|nr:transcriptional regulator [Limosilactobacillus sp.]MCH3922371.1 transcriptional regulator [Limosilactobacillus sp.]MCH3929143.1 transcriptional regulator [Limosilactobacillus sp.]
MIDDIFGKYDKKKSIEAARKWLSQYWDWRDEARLKKPTIGSPSMDGLPTGSLYDADYKIVDYVNAEREWKVREEVLDYIASKGDAHVTYKQILDDRFVHHHWSVTAVRMKLGLSERTFYDYQNEALWEAAKIIPDDHVRVSK